MSFSNNLLLATIEYLLELNSYASDPKNGQILNATDDFSDSSDLLNEKYRLINYNVGGVITIVNRLKKYLQSTGDESYYQVEPSVLLSSLKTAWFVVSEKININPLYKHFYNSDYDPTSTLNYLIAQLLNQFKLKNVGDDKSASEIFDVSINLLNRYSSFIIYQDETHSLSFLTGDEYKQLETTFERLVQLEIIKKNKSLKKIEELRRQGNEVFKQGSFGPAIAKFTEALLLDPSNYLLYSNRAAAFTYLSSHESAIEDLLRATEIKPDFETAWTRLGYSYLGRGKPIDSIKSYVRAIELAHKNKGLPQYLIKLAESLNYSKERATQRGVSRGDIERLTESIAPILKEIEKLAASPSPALSRNAATTTASSAANDTVLNNAPPANQNQSQNQGQNINQQNQNNRGPLNTTPGFVQALNAIGNVFAVNGGDDGTTSTATSITLSLGPNGEVLSNISSDERNLPTPNNDRDSSAQPEDDIDVDDTDVTTEADSRPPVQVLEDMIGSINLPEGLRNIVSQGVRTAVNSYVNRNIRARNANNTSGNPPSNGAPQNGQNDDGVDDDLDLD